MTDLNTYDKPPFGALPPDEHARDEPKRKSRRVEFKFDERSLMTMDEIAKGQSDLPLTPRAFRAEEQGGEWPTHGAITDNSKPSTAITDELERLRADLEAANDAIRIRDELLKDLPTPDAIAAMIRVMKEQGTELAAARQQAALYHGNSDARARAVKERDELKAELEEVINDRDAHLGNNTRTHECQVDKYRSALKDCAIEYEAAEARAEKAEAWPNFIQEYIAWAIETFPSGTAATASKHLQREAKELTDSQEPEEVADCLMLIMFVAHRMGIDLLAEARRKFEANKLRQWNKPDSDGIAEHVRVPPTPPTGDTQRVNRGRYEQLTQPPDDTFIEAMNKIDEQDYYTPPPEAEGAK